MEEVKPEPLPENTEWITEKIKVTKGARPEEWTGTDWWTKEDWDRHNAHVEKLKAAGEYLKQEEVTFTYPKGAFDVFINKGSANPFENIGFLIPNGKRDGYNDIDFKTEPIRPSKIQAYFTPTFPKVDKWGAIEEEAPNKPCKPEHKVDGVIPMLYDLHFDQRSCDCGRVFFRVYECGCSIKEFRLEKIPNE